MQPRDSKPATRAANAALALAARYKFLNPFITPPQPSMLDVAAKADARLSAGKPLSALDGLTVAIKDNIDTADMPTTAGTPALKDWQPKEDAPVVRRLRAAGALLAGKANMHELASGMTSANSTFGDVGNPFSPTANAGGSSGGSAAAVAARIVDAALGSDTGGSVLEPAGVCGIWGFRPSVGRVSTEGVVPLSWTRDTVGWFTRSAAQLASFDAVLSDHAVTLGAPALRGMRFGIGTDLFADMIEPEVAESLERLVATLRGAGCEVFTVDLSTVRTKSQAMNQIIRHEFPIALDRYLRERGSLLTARDVLTAARTPFAKTILGFMDTPHGQATREAYENILMVELPALQQLYIDCFATHRLEALLMPAAPLVAKPVRVDDTVMVNGVAMSTTPAYARYTGPITSAQLPAVSVPCGLTTSGMPMGAMMVGLPMMDSRLLAIAQSLEPVLGPLPDPTATLSRFTPT